MRKGRRSLVFVSLLVAVAGKPKRTLQAMVANGSEVSLTAEFGDS